MKYRASWNNLCESCNYLFRNRMEATCFPIGQMSWKIMLAGVTVQEDGSFEII